MGEQTSIEWTDFTFNPWIGCTKVHDGCTNCYAEADMDKRRGRVKWGPAGTRSRTSDAYWREPLKWDRDAAKAGERRRVFCASLADVFEDWQGPIVNHKGESLVTAPTDGYQIETEGRDEHRPVGMDDLRNDLFRLIDSTPWLDWLLLTKRPENVWGMWPALEWSSKRRSKDERRNVWIGTSVSNQETADKQIPDLFKLRDLTPVLFLSVEPLLGPIDLSPWIGRPDMSGDRGDNPIVVDPPPLDWVIVGGESGPNARPCSIEWIRDLVSQCAAAGVPCFVKQLGAIALTGNAGEPASVVPLRDKKGGDPSEWPEDLRVREWPKT